MLSNPVESLSAVEFIYCECKCGKTIPKYDKKHRIRRFIIGHYGRGEPLSESTKHKLSLANKGHKMTSEQITKLSESLTGRKLSNQHIENIRKSLLGKFQNEENPMWKGDKVQYRALHNRIRKRFPKTEFCQLCGKQEPKHIACITHIYNMDLKNWAWFCVSCHRKWDNTIRNITC